MMGNEYGGDERMEDTVDLPVAMEPVSPMMSILREVDSKEGYLIKEGISSHSGMALEFL